MKMSVSKPWRDEVLVTLVKLGNKARLYKIVYQIVKDSGLLYLAKSPDKCKRIYNRVERRTIRRLKKWMMKGVVAKEDRYYCIKDLGVYYSIARYMGITGLAPYQRLKELIVKSERRVSQKGCPAVTVLDIVEFLAHGIVQCALDALLGALTEDHIKAYLNNFKEAFKLLMKRCEESMACKDILIGYLRELAEQRILTGELLEKYMSEHPVKCPKKEAPK